MKYARFEGGTDAKGMRNWMKKKYTGEITTIAVELVEVRPSPDVARLRRDHISGNACHPHVAIPYPVE